MARYDVWWGWLWWGCTFGGGTLPGGVDIALLEVEAEANGAGGVGERSVELGEYHGGGGSCRELGALVLWGLAGRAEKVELGRCRSGVCNREASGRIGLCCVASMTWRCNRNTNFRYSASFFNLRQTCVTKDIVMGKI